MQLRANSLVQFTNCTGITYKGDSITVTVELGWGWLHYCWTGMRMRVTALLLNWDEGDCIGMRVITLLLLLFGLVGWREQSCWEWVVGGGGWYTGHHLLSACSPRPPGASQPATTARGCGRMGGRGGAYHEGCGQSGGGDEGVWSDIFIHDVDESHQHSQVIDVGTPTYWLITTTSSSWSTREFCVS